MALPYIAWYPRDYLADTTHLTTLQHGAYFLLLQSMWLRGGKLPDDKSQLAGIAKVGVGDFAEIWHALRPFFHKNRQGKLVQKRLTAEHKKAQQLHEVRKKAGSKGGSKAQAKFKLGLSKALARAPATEPEADKENLLRGRSLRPAPVDKSRSVAAAGASARQRAGGALAPAPAGEVREPGEQASEPPATTVGSMRSVGRALPRDLRVPEPETSRENPSDGFRPAAEREREELRQRAYDFAAQRYPDGQKRAAFLGLSGADPEHDAEWWLDTLGELMEHEQWSDPE